VYSRAIPRVRGGVYNGDERLRREERRRETGASRRGWRSGAYNAGLDARDVASAGSISAADAGRYHICLHCREPTLPPVASSRRILRRSRLCTFSGTRQTEYSRARQRVMHRDPPVEQYVETSFSSSLNLPFLYRSFAKPSESKVTPAIFPSQLGAQKNGKWEVGNKRALYYITVQL